MPLQRPEYFHNGEAMWIDHDLLDKLRYGDPISGWSGDPNMNLFYDNVDHCIYLTSFDDNAQEYVVAKSRPDLKIDTMNLLNSLVARDRNRRGGFDLAKEMDANDAKIWAERNAQDDAAVEEVAKKVLWGFKKDMH